MKIVFMFLNEFRKKFLGEMKELRVKQIFIHQTSNVRYCNNTYICTLYTYRERPTYLILLILLICNAECRLPEI